MAFSKLQTTALFFAVVPMACVGTELDDIGDDSGGVTFSSGSDGTGESGADAGSSGEAGSETGSTGDDATGGFVDTGGDGDGDGCAGLCSTEQICSMAQPLPDETQCLAQCAEQFGASSDCDVALTDRNECVAALECAMWLEWSDGDPQGADPFPCKAEEMAYVGACMP